MLHDHLDGGGVFDAAGDHDVGVFLLRVDVELEVGFDESHPLLDDTLGPGDGQRWEWEVGGGAHSLPLHFMSLATGNL